MLLECKVVRNTVSSLNEPVSLDYSHKWVGRPRRSIGDTQQLSLSVFHFELRLASSLQQLTPLQRV